MRHRPTKQMIMTLAGFSLSLLLSSCGDGKLEPVPIYPEDGCSFCRMAISETRFASEILTEYHEVFKFDDIGCLREFRDSRIETVPAAVFMIDYDTGEWMTETDAVVIRTGIRTPMGSGLVATRSPKRAAELSAVFPPEER